MRTPPDCAGGRERIVVAASRVLSGRVVDRKDWNSLAGRFSRDLLEIPSGEGRGVLEEEVAGLARPDGRVADLGCGPGSFLPYLADHFGEVIAIDYAADLLEVARKRCGRGNVSYLRRDLSRGVVPGVMAEVVSCVNALIDPDRRKRDGMGRSLASVVTPGGAAVVVVPSLESVFHVYHSLLRCRRRDGGANGLTERTAERLLRAEVESLAGGIVRVGGVPTKYWMQDELCAFLADLGLVPARVRRIEYGWDEEIEEPPGWLGSPAPWDWLVVAHRAAS